MNRLRVQQMVLHLAPILGQSNDHVTCIYPLFNLGQYAREKSTDQIHKFCAILIHETLILIFCFLLSSIDARRANSSRASKSSSFGVSA